MSSVKNHSFRLYTKENEKGMETFYYKKKTDTRDNAGNEGQNYKVYKKQIAEWQK